MSPDQTLRHTQTRGTPEALRHELRRAGYPVTEGWEFDPEEHRVACVACFDRTTGDLGNHWKQGPCNGTGTKATHHPRVTLDARTAATLGAYCGSESARAAVPLCKGECGLHAGLAPATWRLHDEYALGLYGASERNTKPTVERWLTGLQRLAANVPALEVRGAACKCHGPDERWIDGRYESSIRTCPDCKDTGNRHVPFAKWLSVVAAEAAGRAVLPGWIESLGVKVGNDGAGPWIESNAFQRGQIRNVRKALDSALAWTRCPCAENREALHEACGIGSGRRVAVPEWAWLTSPKRAIQAASQLIGPEATRKAICAEVLGRLGMEEDS